MRTPPARVPLAGVTEVAIGRGEQRAVRREGTSLRVELADRSVSQLHVRVVPSEDRWTLEDAGSKNGTRVNGRRVDRAALADGDVVELGGTFCVVRRAEGPITERIEPAGPTPALRTISPDFERELAVLAKIARSQVPVLVRGESGTGKEVIAQAVHALSKRSGSFVAINCGAVPESLIASELFGSRRGAFSGAEDRTGLVRNADRGTLFLDEITELPATSQTALLRVLQEREVVPVGADKPIAVDARVVAATNRNLEACLADGRFRPDLHARLRGYEIHLPSLSARIEDLGILCASLLDRLEPDKPTRTLSWTAARALFLHRWPYHVRELEQVLRAATAICEGPQLDVEHLQLSTPEPASGGERTRLIALLEKHAGNLSAIARELATLAHASEPVARATRTRARRLQANLTLREPRADRSTIARIGGELLTTREVLHVRTSRRGSASTCSSGSC